MDSYSARLQPLDTPANPSSILGTGNPPFCHPEAPVGMTLVPWTPWCPESERPPTNDVTPASFDIVDDDHWDPSCIHLPGPIHVNSHSCLPTFAFLSQLRLDLKPMFNVISIFKYPQLPQMTRLGQSFSFRYIAMSLAQSSDRCCMYICSWKHSVQPSHCLRLQYQKNASASTEISRVVTKGI